MKVFNSEKIREIDAYTINNEPIESIDLMERAAKALFSWLNEHYDKSAGINVLTGPGNNGGDGLALSRLLADAGYQVSVYHLAFTDKTSHDWGINYERLISQSKADFKKIKKADDFPVISQNEIIIDAIFGSGLSRPAEGLPGEIIKMMNLSDAEIIAVDMPSGLFGEDNSANNPDTIVKAKFTLSLQFPKLSFFFAENQHYIGKFYVLPIGLHPVKISSTETDYNIIDNGLIASILKNRNKFDHKGDFGHGLMVSGSCGKFGAAVLSSHAALRSGIGLLTSHVPRTAAEVLHAALPETMVQCDQSDLMVTEIENHALYDAIGIGPGLGTKPNTKKGLRKLLEEKRGPMVIDADALNIIASENDLFENLGENTILTPHPGEFRRLTGTDEKGYNCLLQQQAFSKKYSCVLVLKGAHTSISLPDGRVWFNTSGNPGMATAGSGDVLTGMILGLLAQNYKPSDAALAAVYIHGMAADIAVENSSYESLIATDIICNIGNAMRRIRQLNKE